MQLQTNLSTQISALKNTLDELSESLQSRATTDDDPLIKSSSAGSRLKKAAEIVHSNASVMSAARSTVWGNSDKHSTTGSENGEPLSHALRSHIESWVTQPKLESITEGNSSGQSPSETQAVFSKTSEQGTTETMADTFEHVDSDEEEKLNYEVMQNMLARGQRSFEQAQFAKAEAILRLTLKRSLLLSSNYTSRLNLKSVSFQLARACFEQRKLQESEELLLRIVQEHARNDAHALLIMDASLTLSSICLMKHDLENAELYAKKTVIGRGRVLGKDHQSYYEAIEMLARIYNIQGNEHEADAWFDLLPKGHQESHPLITAHTLPGPQYQLDEPSTSYIFLSLCFVMRIFQLSVSVV